MLDTIDNKIAPVVAALAVIAMLVALGLVFFYAPIERQMGIVQKLFYAHVPSAMAMYAGFVVSALCSLLYLLRPDELWDSAAVVGAETGLLACLFVLISGPLWAYKAWGTAWTWDPQLTATFVLFVMYGSYVLLRRFGGDGKRIRKVSASLAIIAIVNVPIVHYAVELWGGMHPVVEREGGGGLAPEMSVTLRVMMVAFLLLFAVLFWVRFRNRRLASTIESLYLEIADLERIQHETIDSQDRR